MEECGGVGVGGGADGPPHGSAHGPWHDINIAFARAPSSDQVDWDTRLDRFMNHDEYH